MPDPESYRRLAGLGVDMVRMALPAAVGEPETRERLREHVEAAHEARLRVSVNSIRTSQLEPREVLHRARLAGDLGADVFCIAASNGSLLPARLDRLAAGLRTEFERTLGFHAHDHLTLAFANALVTLGNGFRLIDGTLGGAGKGGGNLRTELLAGHLNLDYGRDYDLGGLTAAAGQWAKPLQPKVPEDSFEQMACGFLDLNLDQIRELREHAAMDGLARHPPFRNKEYPVALTPLAVKGDRLEGLRKAAEGYVSLLDKVLHLYFEHREVRDFFSFPSSTRRLLELEGSAARRVAVCRLDSYVSADLTRVGHEGVGSARFERRRDFPSRPVSLIWNKVNTVYWNELIPRDTSWVERWERVLGDGGVVHLNSFAARCVAEAKTCLALLHEPAFTGLFSEEERALVEALVPWTGRVDNDVVETAVEERADLVLKEPYDIRGDGVTIGRVCEPASWRERLEKAAGTGAVVQRYVRPQRMPVVLAAEERSAVRWNVSLDSFVIDGELAGLGSKANAGDKVNVFQGGSKLAVAVLEERHRNPRAPAA